ncbi:MAG: Dabb family protein [Burkholderiales bacterium]|nr:Dabb family protein [Burkholderiales bacterium]
MAIKHIVMWNLRGESTQEKARAIAFLRNRFESLRGQIPGLLHLEVGVDSSGVDYACDVVLYSVFDSRESLALYATHPAHLRVREELGDLRINRHQVDYAME